MALRRRDGLFEVGMVVLDVAAPILLLVGLRRTTAANVSLLNNFEIVATSLIAWTLFGERISRRLWCGEIGAARTSAYYALAPFMGVGLSFVLIRGKAFRKVRRRTRPDGGRFDPCHEGHAFLRQRSPATLKECRPCDRERGISGVYPFFDLRNASRPDE